MNETWQLCKLLQLESVFLSQESSPRDVRYQNTDFFRAFWAGILQKHQADN